MTVIEVINTARNILNEPLAVGRSFPDDTSSFWTDSVLISYYNIIQDEVQQEIVQVFEDFFITQTSINIVNGTINYSLPADFVKMRRVEDTKNDNTFEIPPITLNEKDREHTFLNTSAASWGNGYYIHGQSIVFDSTPTFTQNSAVKLYYIKRLGEVTAAGLAASTTSEIPQEANRALVWGIVSLALFQQQTENNFARTEFEKHLTRVKAQAENRQLQRPRHVKRSRRGAIRRGVI